MTIILAVILFLCCWALVHGEHGTTIILTEKHCPKWVVLKEAA